MRPDDGAGGMAPADATRLDELVAAAAGRSGPVVAFTGAGISAASGIPTFRGPEGIWTVGSRHHRPEELATQACFVRDPQLVWDWYLHRQRICAAAQPNAAHAALAALDRALGERFLLVTQNVDGLHLAAGNAPQRTLQVHGNLHFERCARECSVDIRPLGEPPAGALPRCTRCGGLARPHVLWFDEMYDEPRYRYRSALAAVERAALVLVVGTSGAVSIAAAIEHVVRRGGIPLVDIDPEPNPFATLAAASAHGCVLRGAATDLVPAVGRRLHTAFAANAG